MARGGIGNAVRTGEGAAEASQLGKSLSGKFPRQIIRERNPYNLRGGKNKGSEGGEAKRNRGWGGGFQHKTRGQPPV